MNRVVLAALLGLAVLIPVQVAAGTNTVPTTALSNELTGPWVVQLKRSSATPPASPPNELALHNLFGPGASSPAAPAPATPQRPAANSRAIDPAFLPRIVTFETREAAGTIIIDTDARYLYLVLSDGKAKRYGVGVGRPGFEWAGTHRVTRKAEWPGWTPPPQMRARQPGLPVHMQGGPDNPLGARALYLGSTLYRIHGSNQPWTIGHAVSSGCIRMRNEDVIDLYNQVGVGTKVVVI